MMVSHRLYIALGNKINRIIAYEFMFIPSGTFGTHVKNTLLTVKHPNTAPSYSHIDAVPGYGTSTVMAFDIPK